MKKILMLLFLISNVNYLLAQESYNLVKDSDFKVIGTIKMTTSKTEFLKQYGKVISIKKYEPECGYYGSVYMENPKITFQEFFKNGIKYIVYGKEADFSEIDFTKKENYLQYNNYNLDKNTTIESLKKIFPKSFKEYKKEKSNSFRLHFDIKDCLDEYIFEIKNKKIVSMIYWTPC